MLYWRGVVLDAYDGKTWSRSEFSVPRALSYNRVDSGRMFPTQGNSYQVMLEPNNQNWVFALENSLPASSNLVAGRMGQYFLKTEAIQPTRYKMAYENLGDRVNVAALPTGAALPSSMNRQAQYYQDLQVPKGINPRARAFVQKLIRENASQYEFVNSVLTYFRTEPFYYTLEPEAISGDFVDEFLFNSRRGFCAHYAGSMAYLLRIAGIPARVVVGYQGGEFNDSGGYLIVHQYDAHAWVEARLPEFGWVRLDPTAMVAPERILGSVRDAVEEDEFLRDDPLGAASFDIGALNWVRLKIDQLNYQWQNLVVNYNQQSHQDFVSGVFGEYSLKRIALVFVFSFVMISLLILGWFWFAAGRRHHLPAERAYLRWLWILRWFGVERHLSETPLAFLERVERERQVRGRFFSMLTRRTAKLTAALLRQAYSTPRKQSNHTNSKDSTFAI